MNQVITLLTAFGLGSIVTAFVQSWLTRNWNRNERKFGEKKSAYIGLLEAYHRAAVERTDEAAKNFAYWQMRCELVASTSVTEAISRIVNTNDDPTGRAQAHDDQKTLCVSISEFVEQLKAFAL